MAENRWLPKLGLIVSLAALYVSYLSYQNSIATQNDISADRHRTESVQAVMATPQVTKGGRGAAIIVRNSGDAYVQDLYVTIWDKTYLIDELQPCTGIELAEPPEALSYLLARTPNVETQKDLSVAEQLLRADPSSLRPIGTENDGDIVYTVEGRVWARQFSQLPTDSAGVFSFGLGQSTKAKAKAEPLKLMDASPPSSCR